MLEAVRQEHFSPISTFGGYLRRDVFQEMTINSLATPSITHRSESHLLAGSEEDIGLGPAFPRESAN